MSLISVLTLLGTLGILLIGHRFFLLDPAKRMNQAFFLSGILMSQMMFFSYELTTTIDYEKALMYRQLQGSWALLDVSLAYACWLVAGLDKNCKIPRWLTYFLWGLATLIAIIIYYLEFSPETMHGELVFIQEGSWGLVISEITNLDIFRGIFLFSTYFAAAGFIYNAYKKERGRRKKKMLFWVAIIIFLSGNGAIIQSWLLPALGIPTDFNQTFTAFIGFLFFGWVFSDFKLFEVKPSNAMTDILDSMTDLMVLTDDYFRIKVVNSAALKLYGKSREELIEQHIKILLPEEEQNNIENNLRSFNLSKNKITEEYTLVVNKKKVNIILNIFPIFNKENKKTGYAFIGSDLTKFKEAHEKVKRTNKQLKKSQEILEQFAFITSHDMKEPLRTVGGFSTLLARKLKPKGEIKEYLDFITEGIQRMNNLVDSILRVSVMNNSEENFGFLNTENIIYDAKKALSSLIEKKKATITTENIPNVWGNKNQIQLLFQNLIENGLKYNNHPSPMVHIEGRRTEGLVQFTVEDNGIGIHPDYHNQIFTMFKRLHNRSQYGGTGVGLAVCNRIVDIHFGKIWVESNEGEGSKFIFTLQLPPNMN